MRHSRSWKKRRPFSIIGSDGLIWDTRTCNIKWNLDGDEIPRARPSRVARREDREKDGLSTQASREEVPVVHCTAAKTREIKETKKDRKLTTLLLGGNFLRRLQKLGTHLQNIVN
jgi:hypothetical protein